MSRLPILGSRGVYLAMRRDGWHLCTPEGDVRLDTSVLTEDSLATALCLPYGSVRLRVDAVEIVS